MLSLEYIAGLFDGEGSVTITKRTRNGSTNYVGVLILSNSHVNVMYMVRDLLGGSLHINKRGKNYDVYSLHMSNNLAYKAAKLLIPYSIIKRQELEALVSFVDKTRSDGVQARLCSRWGKTEDYSILKTKIFKEAEQHIQLILDARKACREGIRQ